MYASEAFGTLDCAVAVNLSKPTVEHTSCSGLCSGDSFKQLNIVCSSRIRSSKKASPPAGVGAFPTQWWCVSETGRGT